MKPTLDRDTQIKLMVEADERHKEIAARISGNAQLRAAFSRPKSEKKERRFNERAEKVAISG